MLLCQLHSLIFLPSKVKNISRSSLLFPAFLYRYNRLYLNSEFVSVCVYTYAAQKYKGSTACGYFNFRYFLMKAKVSSWVPLVTIPVKDSYYIFSCICEILFLKIKFFLRPKKDGFTNVILSTYLSGKESNKLYFLFMHRHLCKDINNIFIYLF
jgi:hypothetical protein